MEKMINKKGRLIYLLKYLYENTDEETPVSTKDLISYFEKMDISVGRKTIKDDIDILIDAGYDIITVKSSRNSFFWGDRHFQVPELKLLIDAVSSSKFITENKSEKLIGKLTALAGKSQSNKLICNNYITKGVKASNEQIYYIVDILTDAINRGKKVEFQYIEYTPEKKKVLRNNGEIYLNSPYALIWNEDKYYLLGFSEKHEKLVQFRVDRISKIKITPIDAIPPPLGFNGNEYAHKSFKMFLGEEMSIELECHNSMMKIIVDRFGEKVEVEKLSDRSFKASVRVIISQNFYGWIFQFFGKIKILSPLSVKLEYENMLRAALEN